MEQQSRHSLAPHTRHHRPIAPLRWLYARFFRHIKVDERWSQAAEDASRRGTTVYVMRSLSFLDFLCLDYLIKEFGLPLLRFVNDLGLWLLEPFGRGKRRLRLKRQHPQPEQLAQVLREGSSALLFLRRPPTILEGPRRQGSALDVDLIRTLVEVQRESERPILLVPQTFVWTKFPASHKRSWLDLAFGPREWPGKLRVLFQFLRNYRNALLRSGDPFDLSQFMAQHPSLSDAEIADKVRYAMLRRIERERNVVLGPAKKGPARIRAELLRSPRVEKHIEARMRATKKSRQEVLKEADKELQKLCADQDPNGLSFLHRLLDWVWNRIYDGLEVDMEGLERLRDAAREGNLILLPSHKSHVDYLILSDVLYTNALSPPLIAAGENLSFWPLGGPLRRGGAFFIKRTFRGNKLYAALVDAYMRRLLVEGFNIEFFLEGGRSRTGKLLPPKLGLLSMVVDAALMLPNKKIFFVPISIGYERIIEERSYVHELSGGEKEKENLSGLLKSSKILRSKYGRLYVQFGELLDFNAMRAEVLSERNESSDDGARDREGGAQPLESTLKPTERRLLVQRLAERTMHEINQATVVTPTALVSMALLTHRRRGMARSALLERCDLLTTCLDDAGARFAQTLRNDDGTLRHDTVDEALRLLGDAKLLSSHEQGDEPVYTVPDERRMSLEYFQNNILHFFVPHAFAAVALMRAGDAMSREGFRERVAQLANLLKHEFADIGHPSFVSRAEESLDAFIEAGYVEALAGTVRVAESDNAQLALFSGLLETYFESLALTIKAAEILRTGALSKKDWAKKALSLGQRLYLSGELERRESLSKLRLDNAFRALREFGLVRVEGGEQLVLTEAASPEALSELESKLQRLIEGA